MDDCFSSYEIGDEVTVNDDMPGVVSFVCKELKTMSICVGRGCHRAEDTNVVISAHSVSKVKRGWPDREVAQAALTPRPCRWYDDEDPSTKS